LIGSKKVWSPQLLTFNHKPTIFKETEIIRIEIYEIAPIYNSLGKIIEYLIYVFVRIGNSK
jgi:hypothetical protein